MSDTARWLPQVGRFLLKPQMRLANFDPRTVDETARTVELSLSSEEPVERWYGWEILDHSPGSVRLERMNNGAALLLNHDENQQVGVIDTAELSGEKLRALARFSKSQQGFDVFRDVRDGIRRNTSIAYIVHKMILESEDRERGNTYRVTDWEPLEGSIVAVPADPTVGVGRTLRELGQEFPVEIVAGEEAGVGARQGVPARSGGGTGPESTNKTLIQNTPPCGEKREERKMSTTPVVTVPPVGAEDLNAVRAQAVAEAQAETKRVQAIQALARTHRMIEKAEPWIISGRTVESIQTEILDLFKTRSNPTAQPPAEAPRVELTDKESKKYSLVRAIRFLAGKDGGFGNVDAGFELEISREIARKLGRDPLGLFIPTSLKLEGRPLPHELIAQSRALSTTAGAGGQTVFTDPGAFIDLLRNALVVRQLGATILSDLVGPVLFPKQLTAGTLTWTQETPGSDVADSDLTTGSVGLSPKSAQSSTAFSRQLLAQSSIDVETLVRNDLVAVNAQGIDKAAIQGTGTLQPLGVLATTGIGDVPIGTDGGYPTYAFLVDLETKLYIANAILNSVGLLTTPGIRGFLKKTPKVANVPDYIWRDGSEEVLSYRSLVTNNVPSTLTKGAKNDCHAIILGNWSDLIIGEWGVVEIIVDPYRLKKQAVIEVTSFVMVDVAVRYPVAFAAIKDARIVA